MDAHAVRPVVPDGADGVEVVCLVGVVERAVGGEERPPSPDRTHVAVAPRVTPRTSCATSPHGPLEEGAVASRHDDALRFYTDMAEWWPLLSAPDDYRVEAAEAAWHSAWR